MRRSSSSPTSWDAVDELERDEGIKRGSEPGLPALELGLLLLCRLLEDLSSLLRGQELVRRGRLAAPMPYMLRVAMARMRGSILTALTTKFPLLQIPIALPRLRVTNDRVPR